MTDIALFSMLILIFCLEGPFEIGLDFSGSDEFLINELDSIVKFQFLILHVYCIQRSALFVHQIYLFFELIFLWFWNRLILYFWLPVCLQVVSPWTYGQLSFEPLNFSYRDATVLTFFGGCRLITEEILCLEFYRCFCWRWEVFWCRYDWFLLLELYRLRRWGCQAVYEADDWWLCMFRLTFFITLRRSLYLLGPKMPNRSFIITEQVSYLIFFHNYFKYLPKTFTAIQSNDILWFEWICDI